MTQACFRGKRTLKEESRPGEVARAVARAKQGDRQAVRFLDLRYADLDDEVGHDLLEGARRSITMP